MGTRSLTVFMDDDRKRQIVVLYRQFDGYPEGHGRELADILKRGHLINGISGGDDDNFNGMGCLTAKVVAALKKNTGGFYLYPADTNDCGEDYIYTVYPGAKKNQERDGYTRAVREVNLKVQSYDGTVIYDGPAREFDAAKLDEEAKA